MISKENATNRPKCFSTELVPTEDYYSPPHLADMQLEINLDRRYFWNMLVTYIPKSGYLLANDFIKILDIGCGKCREAAVLNSFFGQNNFNQPNPNVVITGIDIRNGFLEEAKEENKYSPFTLRLINGDAARLSEYPEIPSRVDVVIIRHQEMINDKKLWTQIFKEAIEKMSDSGLGIITSYTNSEHDLAVKKLKSLGQKIILASRNKFARPTRVKGVSVDKNIILFRKYMQ